MKLSSILIPLAYCISAGDGLKADGGVTIGGYKTFRGASATLKLVQSATSHARLVLESQGAPLLVSSRIVGGGIADGSEFVLTYKKGENKLSWPLRLSNESQKTTISRLPPGAYFGCDLAISAVEQSLRKSAQWKHVSKILKKFSDAELAVRVSTSHLSDMSLYESYRDGFVAEKWVAATSGRYRRKESLQSMGVSVALSADGHLRFVETGTPGQIVDNEIQVKCEGSGSKLSFRIAVAKVGEPASERIQLEMEIRNTGNQGVSVFDPFGNDQIRPNSIALMWGRDADSMSDYRDSVVRRVNGAECVDWLLLSPNCFAGRMWSKRAPTSIGDAPLFRVSVKQSLFLPCTWLGMPRGSDEREQLRRQFLTDASESMTIVASEFVRLKGAD